jgi:hypothetical protein
MMVQSDILESPFLAEASRRLACEFARYTNNIHATTNTSQIPPRARTCEPSYETAADHYLSVFERKRRPRTSVNRNFSPSSSRKKCSANLPGQEVDLSGSFAAQSILQSANRILHLANSLLGLAFSLQLLIAEHFSGDFFHGSLGLRRRTFDSILIHGLFSIRLGIEDSGFIDVLFAWGR